MSNTQCAVYELRQYTLQPGTGDAFLAYFEQWFLESQETTGMHVVGQFRDLDRPDMFVWMRGFPDMVSRRDSLDAFYGGPVWAARGAAANAMMIDSDNVLLLKPVGPRPWFETPRGGPDAAQPSPALFEVVVYPLAADGAGPFAEFYDQQLAPLLTSAGTTPIAEFETETAPNTFPRLPVRETETVFVTVSRFVDLASYDVHVKEVAQHASWDQLKARSRELTIGSPQVMRLVPGPRSAVQ
jgi:hypothetical protein